MKMKQRGDDDDASELQGRVYPSRYVAKSTTNAEIMYIPVVHYRELC